MLRLLPLVGQFKEIERELVEDWAELTLELKLTDERRAERAAALLAPANPGLSATKIRFAVDRGGPGIGPEAARRLLRRLDQERIEGTLELVRTRKTPMEALTKKEPLREQWDRRLAPLPADWSDLYAQVTLDSSDYLEPAALLLAPVNPSRFGTTATFRYRVAHHFGYGASPEMAARCFSRCDEQGITGAVEILHVLSDTQPIGTQGPVWLMGGRTV
jgi:hypothetical protein